MTLAELLSWGKNELSELDSEEAQASAEVLLSEVLSLPRASLYLESRQSVCEDDARKYREWIAGRKKRIPTAYLTGTAHFWNETLSVNSGCLVPRPETETLVKAFIDCSGFSQNNSFSFADLGTGSGAIGIALLREFPQARCSFLDISEKALAVTAGNVERYGLSSRARLLKTDLFEACRGEQWDAVVSNPPYFDRKDWSEVEPEVLHEPRQALDGGIDGLLFYRRIAENVARYLKPSGCVFVEVGRGQSIPVKDIFISHGLGRLKTFKDDLDIERVVMARTESHG